MVARGWEQEEIIKRQHEGFLLGTGIILCPVCGDDYKNLCMCKTSKTMKVKLMYGKF